MTRPYLKIPVIDPASGVFTSIPGLGIPIPILNTPPITGACLAPATATATAGPTPHRGSAWDRSSDFPQERIISTAEEVEWGSGVQSYGSSHMGFQLAQMLSECSQRPLFLVKEGLPSEGFLTYYD